MNQTQKRSKIVALLGVKTKHCAELIKCLGNDISHKYGGVFINKGQGFWSSHGNQFLDHYPPTSITEELCIKIELLVMPKQASEAIQHLGERCAFYNQQWNLECEYLHIEQHETTTHHTLINKP